MSRAITVACLTFLAACRSYDAGADATPRETRNEAPAPAAPSAPAKPKPAPRDPRRDAMPQRPQVASKETPAPSDATKSAESTSIPAPARSTREETKVAETKDVSAAQRELEEAAKSIQTDIEKLRNESFVHDVPVKLASKATLVEYMEDREKLETTPERERFLEECPKLLGLIPADMDLKAVTQAFLEKQIGGFYDPPTKTFFVMDNFTGEIARVIMAHEFVHALDDQHYDLDAISKKIGEDSDKLLAFRAVCEGSGTLTMMQWQLGHMASIDKAALAEFEEMTTGGMEDLPPFVWKPTLAAYLSGMNFLSKSAPRKSKAKKAETEASAPKEGVEAKETTKESTYSQRLASAFRDPPSSCEQILHPEKYWDPSKKDEPKRVTFDTSKVPSGWKVLGEDTLGELYLAMLTTPRDQRKGLDVKNQMAVMALQYTNKAAAGWGGDRVIVLGRGDDRVLELVTVWDTADDAEEFADALSGDVLPMSGELGSAVVDSIDHKGESKSVRITIVRAQNREGVPTEEAVPWKIE